jgi:AbrB family looped-hinge helix DNA binding protein
MQVEDIVSVSSKGQIVLPKKIRRKFGIEPGKKLLVASDEYQISLRKLEDLSLEEISERTSKETQAQGIDIPTLVDEAINWARKDQRKRGKQSSR